MNTPQYHSQTCPCKKETRKDYMAIALAILAALAVISFFGATKAKAVEAPPREDVSTVKGACLYLKETGVNITNRKPETVKRDCATVGVNL